MRRAALYPLMLALALATAVALLGSAAALGDASPPDSPAATEAAVRRFYAAVNDAIRTGDATALEAAVGPGLVDHAPPPGIAPDRAGLARYLAVLHATSPAAELVVENLVAAGDRALAWLTVRGAGRAGFLGAPPGAAPPPWSAVDAVRVAGGRVVERWGDAARVALLEPLGAVALDTRLPRRPVVALERLTLAAGGRLDAWRPPESHLIRLEAGALTVSIMPDSPGPAQLAPAAARDADARPTVVGPGGSIGLEVGDLLALPPRTGYTLRNDAAAPAEALVLTVSRAGAPASYTDGCNAASTGPSPACWTAAGAAVRPLAGGRFTGLPAGPSAVAVGRVILAPKAALPVHTKAGPGLLFVEAGSLGLATDDGSAWVRDGGTGVGSEVEAGTLGAGDGALLRLGTAATLRNPGATPASVLVVAILPADGAEGVGTE